VHADWLYSIYEIFHNITVRYISSGFFLHILSELKKGCLSIFLFFHGWHNPVSWSLIEFSEVKFSSMFCWCLEFCQHIARETYMVLFLLANVYSCYLWIPAKYKLLCFFFNAKTLMYLSSWRLGMRSLHLSIFEQ